MIVTVFKFHDGTEKRHEGLGRPIGLRHNWERPHSAVISTTKGYVLNDVEKEGLKRYIYMSVIPSLHPQHHEIGVSPTIADALENHTKEMYISFKEH